MSHHAEAMTAAGLRSASREEPLQLEAAQPIDARRHRLHANARLHAHASAKFNHALALRKREYLGTMHAYIFCRLHDVMVRECEALGDSAQDWNWPTAVSDDDY